MKNIKTLFNILFVMILSERTYSQQKVDSKILSFLSQELRDSSLYCEPMDSIIKKFKHNIVGHSQNLKLSYDPKYYFQPNTQTKYEESITILPTNITMFHQFRPDTIFFYFKDKKLVKGHCHFKVDKNAAELILTDILDKISQVDENGINNNLHYTLWDDNQYAKLNYVYDYTSDSDKNKLLNAYLDFVIIPPPETDLTDNQTNPRVAVDYSTLENQIKTNRHGKGNNTFNLSISKLESIINSHTTLKMLELQFGSWNSDGDTNYLSFEYDERTKDHTIPLFEIYYGITIKGKDYTIKASVSKNLKNPVRDIAFTADLNGLQLAEFKESLRAHNYLLNENTTELLNKMDFSAAKYIAYEKRTGKMHIDIKYNENGSYTIEVSK